MKAKSIANDKYIPRFDHDLVDNSVARMLEVVGSDFRSTSKHGGLHRTMAIADHCPWCGVLQHGLIDRGVQVPEGFSHTFPEGELGLDGVLILLQFSNIVRR